MFDLKKFNIFIGLMAVFFISIGSNEAAEKKDKVVPVKPEIVKPKAVVAKTVEEKKFKANLKEGLGIENYSYADVQLYSDGSVKKISIGTFDFKLSGNIEARGSISEKREIVTRQLVEEYGGLLGLSDNGIGLSRSKSHKTASGHQVFKLNFKGISIPKNYLKIKFGRSTIYGFKVEELFIDITNATPEYLALLKEHGKNILTEEECLMIAKRHMVEYMANVGILPTEDNLSPFMPPYRYEEGGMGMSPISSEPYFECNFAFRGGKKGEDFNVITVNPLTGEVTNIYSGEYPRL